MRVAVVILNYNGRNFLEKFLPSVEEHSGEAEIIIADNASTDDSVQFLKEHYPNLRIIKNASNGGFAKGYNDALKHVDADYYVLLNSDIEVAENWIDPVIAEMEKDETIAAAQPKILAYQDKTKFEHAGASGGYIDKWGYAFCRGRFFDHTEEDKGQYDDTVEVFWATGACMFIKADAFHEFDGFDDDFFAHMEEIDLCWRMKNCGRKIICVPKAKVYHVGGGTLNYMSPRKTFLNFRNNLFMLYKNYRGRSLFFMLFFRLFLDGIAAWKFLFTGKPKHFWAVMRAHFFYYWHLIKLISKRRHLKRCDTDRNTSGIYTKSVVKQYFINKVTSFSELKNEDFLSS